MRRLIARRRSLPPGLSERMRLRLGGVAVVLKNCFL